MKSDAPISVKDLSDVELRVLQAIRELSFGVVEVVIHERKIAEIRQTKRIRNVQEVNFSTGQPENEKNQRNNDRFYRVVRKEKDTTV